MKRVQLSGSNSKAVGYTALKESQPDCQLSPLTPCCLRSCLKKASEVACLLRGGHLTVALQGESHDPQGPAHIIQSIHNSQRLPLINVTLAPPSLPYHTAAGREHAHSVERVYVDRNHIHRGSKDTLTPAERQKLVEEYSLVPN